MSALVTDTVFDIDALLGAEELQWKIAPAVRAGAHPADD